MADFDLARVDPLRSVQAGNSYVNQLYDATAKRQAGQQYASGDLQGASSTLAQRGDIAGAQQLDATRTKRSGEEYEYVANALPLLYQIAEKSAGDPDGGAAQRAQAFDQIAQEFAVKTGAPAQVVPQLKDSYAKDPKGFLQRLDAQLPSEYKTVGRSVVRQRGNQVEEVYTAPTEYKPPRIDQITEGDTLKTYEIDQTNGQRKLIAEAPRYKPQAMGGGGPSPSDIRQDRRYGVSLRQQFNNEPEVKDFNIIANQVQTISDLAKRPGSAQDDVAAIFSFMKVLDPTSVVREGEFATAQNAAGIPDRVQNLYNQARNGQRLNAEQRKQLASTAKSFYSSKKNRYDQIVGQYKGYASEAGLPDTVIQQRLDLNAGGGTGPKVLKFNPATGKLE